MTSSRPTAIAPALSTAPHEPKAARAPSPSFFGAFPERGIWSAVGLRRAQFFAILALSIALFVVVGGPVWRHVRDPHFLRITVSYAVIPVGVVIALWRNGAARPVSVLAASAVLALVKLVATAALLIVLALARG